MIRMFFGYEILLSGEGGNCREVLCIAPDLSPGQCIKKAHPTNQMSFNMVKIFSALDLTYLSANWRMELAPFRVLRCKIR